jgi:hypothetical protein
VFTAVPELILCNVESEELMHKPSSYTAKPAAWLYKAETVQQVTIPSPPDLFQMCSLRARELAIASSHEKCETRPCSSLQPVNALGVQRHLLL